MEYIFHKNRLAFYIITAFLMVISISYIGGFKIVNNGFYDFVETQSINIQEKQKELLLVEVEEKNFEDFQNNIQDLLDNITKKKPKSFIFLFDKSDLNITIKNNKIVSYFVYTIEQSNISKEFFSIKQEIINQNYDGFVVFPLSLDGVLRYGFNSFDTNIGTIDSFYKEISSKNKDSYIKDKFYINFLKYKTIPKISYKHLVDNSLISELISNKHIIFGYKKRFMENGITTPLATSIGNISYLEYFGYSLNSMLQNDSIERIDFIYLFLYSFLTLTIISFLYYFRVVINFYLILLSIFLFVIIFILLLYFFNIWFDIIEPIVILLVIGFIFNWFEKKEADKLEQKLLLNASEELKKRMMYKSFFNSKDYWEHISTLTGQMLNLNKVIFLEKVEADHRLKEIKAVGCTLDDIYEMRRDYEREPYKSAVSLKSLIDIKDRQFFKNLSDEEEQYIVALIYSNQVMGFWVFTASKNIDELPKNFKTLIDQFSIQISELLFHRWEWNQRDLKKKNNIFGIDSKKPISNLFGTVTATLKILEKRLTLLETIIDKFQSGVVLYDIFGRVYHINSTMQETLQDVDIRPFNITGEQLVAILCELSPSKSKKIFSDAIINKEPFILQVKKELKKSHHYIVIGSSITKKNLKDDFKDTFFFDSYGIMVQLIDITQFKEQSDIKTYVIKESNNNLQKLLQNIEKTSIEYLSSNKELNNKIREFIFEFNKMDDIVNQDIFFGSDEYYPMDINIIIQRVIVSFNQIMNNKNIDYKIEPIDFFKLVFVNPVFIDEVISELIDFLIEDSVNNTIFKISFDIEDIYLVVIMSNQGYGMPNSEFQKLLNSNKEYIDKNYITLKHNIQKIKNMEGDLKIVCEHGKGFEFKLYFKRY